MATTVIDSLLVTLGLDPSGYKKGSDEAAKQTQKVKKEVKESSEAMVKALNDVGRSVAVMFLGFESAAGLGRFLIGLNNANANLSNISKNLGLSVHEVDAWDQAVKLAGGTAEEAQGSLSGLSEQLTSFLRGAGSSELVNVLLRAGVAIKDAKGNVRSTVDIYKDLAKVLDGMDRQQARNLLASSGVSANVVNLLLAERTERERILALGRENAVVTDEQAAAALALRTQWNSVQEKIAALGQAVLAQILPPMQQFLDYIGKIDASLFDLSAGFKFLGSIAVVIKTAFQFIGEQIGAVVAAIAALLHGDFANAGHIIMERLREVAKAPAKLGGELYELWNPYNPVNPKTGAPSGVRNNNPGNLRAFAPGQPVDERGIRVFKNLEEGTDALKKQIALDVGTRGLNIEQLVNKYAPAADNNNVPAYIAALVKATGKGARDKLTAADQEAIIRGIVEHEGAANAAGRAKVSALLAPNPSALLATRGGEPSPNADASRTSNRTTTNTATVENMTVVTQATDANGIAAALPGAIARKGLILQADTGMT